MQRLNFFQPLHVLYMPIDNKLIESCIKKDRRAQHALHKECYTFLIRIGYRYTKSKEEAVSLFNNAFLKILNQLHTYNAENNFEFWAKKIMINTVIDEYRKNKRYDEKFNVVDWSESEEMDAIIDADRADKKFDLEDIMSMIQTLPNSTKNVFNLFVIDGYSHKEIAAMMNISEGTSKWHLSEARKLLIKKIEAGIITLLLLV
jgi:RNA polymerase sigma factor (sigma-70 family)